MNRHNAEHYGYYAEHYGYFENSTFIEDAKTQAGEIKFYVLNMDSLASTESVTTHSGLKPSNTMSTIYRPTKKLKEVPQVAKSSAKTHKL
jgi:pyruvoyl-dependent arginine decarboxylase (PvlArgDC)